MLSEPIPGRIPPLEFVLAQMAVAQERSSGGAASGGAPPGPSSHGGGGGGRAQRSGMQKRHYSAMASGAPVRLLLYCSMMYDRTAATYCYLSFSLEVALL